MNQLDFLNKAKMLMEKVETNDFKPVLDENIKNKLLSGGVYNGSISKDSIKKSKLPDFIKESFLEKPPMEEIPKAFDLDDIEPIIDNPTPKINPPKPQQNIPKSDYNFDNNQYNDKITISETALRSLIKDVLLEFLINDYNKRISENVVKSTIKTLLKEGKIKS